MDLFSEREDLRDKLNTCIKMLRDTGGKFAEAERAYKIGLRKKALELRDRGFAVGMIDKIIYGEEEVADLRFERDVAEVNYKANQDAVNSYKLQLRLVEAQLQREWSVEQ